MDRLRKTPRLVTVAAIVVVVAAAYLAKGVLIPFALAVLVSFVLGPLVLRLQRRGVPRVLAVAAAILLLFALSAGVAWVVAGEVRDLAAKLPEYRENIRQKSATLREFVALPFEQAQVTVEHLGSDLAAPAKPKSAAPVPQTVRVLDPVPGPLQTVRDVFEPLRDIVTTLAMVVLFAVLMLLRPQDLGDRLIRIVGSGQIYLTTKALDEASSKVSSYLLRQLLLNGLLGLGVGIGLALVGIPGAVLWGFLFAVLRFVPYVGAWIAGALPVVLSFATSNGWLEPLETIGVFALLELTATLLIEPWIYGAGTGISPLAILLSALFWSWLWGPIGLVLATPMTVCLVVMGKYIPQLHFLNLLFSDAPGLPPPARLYQRLLAQDQDEAWNVVKAEIGTRSVQEIHDSIVLPALSLAEHDRQRGTLDEESSTQIHESVRLLLDEIEEARPTAASDGEDVASGAGAGLRVLCLPARSAADLVAAEMLARVLAREGAKVKVAPLAELVGETLNHLGEHPADMVFISAVPPSGFMHVRYICKRLANEAPDLEILVGMWTLDLTAPELVERAPKGEHVHIVASFGEALATLRRMSTELRMKSEARVAKASAAG